MRVKVILNPYANRWGARAQIPAVQAALETAGLDYHMVMTERVGEGIDEAHAAIGENYDAVVAAGGDSTVNEVINGLISAAGDGPTIPFGVMPLGTGNDFADMTGIPRNLNQAAHVIAAGATRAIDAGRVNQRYFDNNSAVAMEPMVTLENIRMTRLSGNLRYVVALFRALARLKAWQMEVVWDDGRYEGPVYLLSVCNSARTGGIFQMAPGAVMDDGLLDFVLLPEVSRLQVLALLPGLFSGRHINNARITFTRTTRLHIKSQPGTPLHTDGEIIGEAVEELDYEVLPGKICLLAGSFTET